MDHKSVLKTLSFEDAEHLMHEQDGYAGFTRETVTKF